MIELAAHRKEACFDAVQTLAIRQLREGESKGTDPRKKIHGIYDGRHNDPRISETRRPEGDPSVARISFGQHSYPILRGMLPTVADALASLERPKTVRKISNRKILKTYLTHAESSDLLDRQCHSRTIVRRPAAALVDPLIGRLVRIAGDV